MGKRARVYVHVYMYTFARGVIQSVDVSGRVGSAIQSTLATAADLPSRFRSSGDPSRSLVGFPEGNAGLKHGGDQHS